MKKNYSAIAFLLIIFTIAAANFVYGYSDKTDTEKLDTLSFSDLIDGNFSQRFDNYFAKNFIFRDKFIELSKKVTSLKGIQKEKTVEIVDFKGVNVDKKHKIENTVTKEAEESTTKKVESNVADTEWGKILIYDDSAMEINTFSEPAAKNYAESINLYAEAFPDIEIHSMMVPTLIDFIDNNDYKDLSVNQKETITKTQSHLNTRVNKVPIYDKLKEHSDEYIYLRTDHHWTQLGAFYAYQVFSELLGQEKPSLSNYSYEKFEGYLGSLHRVTQSKVLEESPDTIELYDPEVPHKYYSLSDTPIPGDEVGVYKRNFFNTEYPYAVFLGGDKEIVKIETENSFNRNILVLKDSYANAFIPFLVSSFDNIIVVDPRQFSGSINSVIEQQEISDILFINYTLITRWDGYSKLYKDLLD